MCNKYGFSLLGAIALLTIAGGVASAQVNVQLPDTSQTTTLNANVSQQCNITVPTNINFTVTDITQSTLSSGSSDVTIQDIVLAANTNHLLLSIKANAASFTPSVTGSPTWSATAVSWNAATISSSGTGSTGTLSSSAFGLVATSGAGATDCTTTGLQFTLAADTSVSRAGDHTLVITWKVANDGL